MTTQLSFDAPKAPVIDDERHGLYLAYARRFKAQDAADVVEEAIAGYRRKFNREPECVLTSHADAQTLEGHTSLRVCPKTYIQSGCFYVGVEAA